MVREVLEEIDGCKLPPTLETLTFNKKSIRYINEFGLYEILFRSNSSIAKQFRKEICEWLRKTRLEQKLILEERVKQLKEENDAFKEEKR